MPNILERAYCDILNNNDMSDTASKVITHIRSNIHTYSPKWHALGFIHCRLYKNEQGTLRMHIWPKNLTHPLEQDHKIHDHIFSLTSYVICGEVTNINYKLSQVFTPDTDTLQIYHVKYNDNGSSLIPSRNYYHANIEDEFTCHENQFYSVDRGVFHQSKVDRKKMVATLVATSNHTLLDPKMLGDPKADNTITRGSVTCPTSVWDSMLANLMPHH